MIRNSLMVWSVVAVLVFAALYPSVGEAAIAYLVSFLLLVAFMPTRRSR